MTTLARLFLGAEAAGFGAAACLHAGVFARGYEHSRAATAETVIGLVLLGALVGTFIAPARSRPTGLGALAFAMLGTAVGVFTMAIGVGPRTTLDVMIHAAFVISLLVGLMLIARRRPAGGSRSRP